MYNANIFLPNVDDVKSFVKAANSCEFDVDLIWSKYVVDAKSIMGVFSLPLSNILELRAECDENNEFVNEIKKYVVEQSN